MLGCVLCVVGSTTIVLHAPQERNIESVKEVWVLATEPGFSIPSPYIYIYIILYYIILYFHAFNSNLECAYIVYTNSRLQVYTSFLSL